MISTRLSRTIWGGLLGGGAVCIEIELTDDETHRVTVDKSLYYK